jgi:amino acid adenylation domain-containing protein
VFFKNRATEATLGRSGSSFLHEPFEAQAKRSPLACAVVHGKRRLTYHELDKWSTQLAKYLRSLRCGPESKIVIHLEPSVEMLGAMLAALKTGGAYVPISTTTSKSRLRCLLKDINPAALITVSRCVENDIQSSPFPIICLDTQSELIGAQYLEPFRAEVLSENLAYVIYTSGSTGEPKGVMVSHRGICNTLQWRQENFSYTPADRILLTLSFTFDASLFQLFQPLMVGACIVIPEVEHGGDPARIIRLVRNNSVTILATTGSIWRLLVNEPELTQCVSLRLAFSGGEPLDPGVPIKLKRSLGIEINNMYGPTEASMEATYSSCLPGEPISIGRPIANVKAYLLADNLQPVPSGKEGELYLGGLGIARGYLNDPAMTAERFQPDPYSTTPGSRMYRTGDICRWLPDGRLEYIGRRDRQVKVRGHRVELGEIEAVIQKSLLVRDSTVVLSDDKIVAYIVRENEDISETRIRKYLRSILPSYMIPPIIIFLGALPRNSSGKVDRGALPRPQRPPLKEMSRAHSLEQVLAEMWERCVGVCNIEGDDNLFELGVDSFHVAVFSRQLEELLGEIVHTVVVYDAPTVNRLARYLRLNYAGSISRLFDKSPRGLAKAAINRSLDRSAVATLRELIRPLPARSNPVEIKNSRAIFILSSPRSGSTLTRIMLGAHPALFAPPELQLLNFNTLGDRRNAFSASRDEFWLQGTIRAIMELKDCGADEAARVMTEFEQLDMPTKQFYAFMQSGLGDITLVDKTPTYSLDMRVLRRAEEDFHNACYIHLIRHPADVIRSFEEARLHVFFPPFLTREHDFTSRELGELVWDVCEDNIGEFLQSVPPDRQHVIQFEELVSAQRRTMEKVSDFLGISFHTEMINVYSTKNQRRLMTEPAHPLGRMLGDVKFQKHGRINPDRGKSIGRYSEVTLSEVTQELARGRGYAANTGSNAILECFQVRGSAPALFCVHAADGDVWCYRELARKLGEQRPFYAFRVLPDDDGATLCGSIQGLASYYVQKLREVQSCGPYQLGGWSFGGLVAFEMALQLAAVGQEIGVLALFDSYLPRSNVLAPGVPAVDLSEEYAEGYRTAKPRPTVGGPVSRRSEVEEFVGSSQKIYLTAVKLGRSYAPNSRLRRVVVFEAQDQLRVDRSVFKEWSDVADDVRRHSTPGDHFSIMQSPNVDALAMNLERYLLPARLN